MAQNEIQNLIGYKEDRLQILKAKKQSLVDLEAEISKSSLVKTMQTALYQMKRFLLLFFAAIFLLVGTAGLVYPDLLFLNSSKYKSDFVDDFKTQYQNETSKNFEISLKEFKGNSKANSKTLEQNIDNAIVKTALKNVHFSIRILAFVLLCFAGLIWYASRLTKKIKASDNVIAKVVATNKEIIKDYELSIDEEQREIIELKKQVEKL